MGWEERDSFPYNKVSVVINAPIQSGVYGIRKENRWIYFGESSNVCQRLLAHLDGFEPSISAQGATHFTFEPVPEESRVRRRNALILQFDPPGNRYISQRLFRRASAPIGA